jgi:hypothetical protein
VVEEGLMPGPEGRGAGLDGINVMPGLEERVLDRSWARRNVG